MGAVKNILAIFGAVTIIYLAGRKLYDLGREKGKDETMALIDEIIAEELEKEESI